VNFFQTYAKELFSLLVPIVAWGLKRAFQAKAKLVLATPHRFTFLVQEPWRDETGKVKSPTQTVNTTSFLLKNTGSVSAKNVELVFNWKPLCLNYWPPRHTTEHIEPDNRYVLIFDSLAPNEVIGCELLSINYDNPDLVTARCEQCVSQTIEMYPQAVAKLWQIRTIQLLSFAGLGTVVYLILFLLQFLILKTPH
jgi:hypothetical protein